MSDVVILDELPPLLSLQQAVYNMQLLNYMMTCYRTPPSYYLPVPPPPPESSESSYVEPGSPEEQSKIKLCIERLGNSYTHMLVMLMDDAANEREKLLVQNHVTIVSLQKWLPAIKLEDAVRCPIAPSIHMTICTTWSRTVG